MSRIRSKYTHPDFQFTCFNLDGVSFGITIKCVKEVIRCKGIIPIEDGPTFVEGIVRLRSMAVPVVDLRKRFNVKPRPGRTPNIIIVSVNGRITGLVVDEVREIMTGGKELLPGAHEKAEEPWRGCVDMVLETGCGPVMVLDLSKLFYPSELAMLDAPFKAKGGIKKAN